jgi:hypothetical protein
MSGYLRDKSITVELLNMAIPTAHTFNARLAIILISTGST